MMNYFKLLERPEEERIRSSLSRIVCDFTDGEVLFLLKNLGDVRNYSELVKELEKKSTSRRCYIEESLSRLEETGILTYNN